MAPPNRSELLCECRTATEVDRQTAYMLRGPIGARLQVAVIPCHQYATFHAAKWRVNGGRMSGYGARNAGKLKVWSGEMTNPVAGALSNPQAPDIR
jgi:hypothetical protein